jgi:hypothetical protein
LPAIKDAQDGDLRTLNSISDDNVAGEWENAQTNADVVPSRPKMRIAGEYAGTGAYRHDEETRVTRRICGNETVDPSKVGPRRWPIDQSTDDP